MSASNLKLPFSIEIKKKTLTEKYVQNTLQ